MSLVDNVHVFVRKTSNIHGLKESFSYSVVNNACPVLFHIDVVLFDAALQNKAYKTHATLQLLQGVLDPRRWCGVSRPQLEDMQEALLSCS